MSRTDARGGPCQCTGRIRGNRPLSEGLIRLDLDLPLAVHPQPGQFAMLNPAGTGGFVFGRPFSLLAWQQDQVSFLYRVVGRGTAALARMQPGDALHFLGPLGRPFPGPPADRPVVLVAGGVGLPPLYAWWRLHARPDDTACFGARRREEVPWKLLGPQWRVSVEEDPTPRDPAVHLGMVTELIAGDGASADVGSARVLLACGPEPMLRACARLAHRHRWECWLSLEEHMGCGYGVCKGCVVPVRTGSGDWRNATCCQDGPVFNVADLGWTR